MGEKDARVDAYIERSAEFARPILNHLRSAVHAACPDVAETIKWSMPFFEYKGPLCHMAAFKAHCAFGFWKGRMFLGEQGKDGMGHLGRLTGLRDLPASKILAGHLRRAVELNDAGIKPSAKPRSKEKKDLVVPDDFQKELRKNPKARKNFDGFSYSHKKEYLEWITEAKREETRLKRIQTALDWISTGKPRHWKYANC